MSSTFTDDRGVVWHSATYPPNQMAEAREMRDTAAELDLDPHMVVGTRSIQVTWRDQPATLVVGWAPPDPDTAFDLPSPAKMAEDAMLLQVQQVMRPERRQAMVERVARTTERLVTRRRTASVAEQRAAAWQHAWMESARDRAGIRVNDRPTSTEQDDAGLRLAASISDFKPVTRWDARLAAEAARVMHLKRFVDGTLTGNELSLYADVLLVRTRQGMKPFMPLVVYTDREDRYDPFNPRIWVSRVDARAAEVLAEAVPGIAEGMVLVMPFITVTTRNGWPCDADERDQVKGLLPLYLLLPDEFAAMDWYDRMDDLLFEAARANHPIEEYVAEATDTEVEVLDEDAEHFGWIDEDGTFHYDG